MCGIIAHVDATAEGDVLSVLLEGLSKLEYRGYDSAGVAIANHTLSVTKRAGELEVLQSALTEENRHGFAGLGHTRWSTHGSPTEENAHPHTGCDDRVGVVHNGVVDNYRDLREALESQGHTFESDTDTEVIPHLIEAALDAGDDPERAFERAVHRLEGSYAVAAVFSGEDIVCAARNESPLVLGIGEDGYYLASDVTAFLAYTDRVVYLEDGQFATIRPTGAEVTNGRGAAVEMSIETVSWEPEEAGKSGYDHYMLKEIYEQPRAVRECLSGRPRQLDESVTLESVADIARPERVHFVACGTSYHASMYAACLFRERGVPADAYLASEYDDRRMPIEDATLVVGVTQSGETADTLGALRAANRAGAETLSVTNVVGSSAARETDHVLYIRAGPEIAVAATKSFVTQQVALAMLSSAITDECSREFVAGLRALPNQIQSILDANEVETVAEAYVDADAYFFLGRGLGVPVALEGALKMKEITYKHAEGFPAGELKHGPLALVTERSPVFALLTDDDREQMITTVREVESRGAPVVAITDSPEAIQTHAEYVLSIPETHRPFAPILANVHLQLVAYWVAHHLGRSIDKPRHLAKSVTVR